MLSIANGIRWASLERSAQAEPRFIYGEREAPQVQSVLIAIAYEGFRNYPRGSSTTWLSGLSWGGTQGCGLVVVTQADYVGDKKNQCRVIRARTDVTPRNV